MLVNKIPRIDWYQLLYKTEDPVLIKMFWRFFNRHKMSKNRCARSVLLRYYSTTPVPEFVQKAFSFYHDCKLVQANFYEL